MWRIMGVLTLGVLLTSAVAVCAKDEHKEGAEKKAHHGEGDKDKKGHAPSKVTGHGTAGDGEAKENPIFPWPPDLGIWTLVVFLVLLFVLRKYAWLPIIEGLEKREANIAAAEKEARLARQESQQMTADYERKMKEAYAEIPKIMEAARREAEQSREEVRSSALAEIQSERQKLRSEVESSTAKALQEIRDQSSQLAALITAKAVGRELGADEHAKLTKEALAEMQVSSK